MKPNIVSLLHVEASQQFHIEFVIIQHAETTIQNAFEIKIKEPWAEGDLQKAIDLPNSVIKSYRNIAKEFALKELTL